MKQQPTPSRPDATTAALAKLMQPGTAVILPHAEAGRLSNAMLQVEKPVRLRNATSTHTSVEYPKVRPTPTAHRAPPLWSLPRALATGVLCIALGLLVSGCGGGADLEDAEDLQRHPPINCAAMPARCI